MLQHPVFIPKVYPRFLAFVRLGALPLMMLLFSLLLLPRLGQAQVTLPATSPYTENFNTVGTALPTGWSVRSGATTTFLGNTEVLVTTPTTWSNTAGNFRNVAAADAPIALPNAPNPTTETDNAVVQAARTDRALGLRQNPPGPFGDPGAAFVLQLDNTLGKTAFSASFKFQMLAVNPRITRFTVDYGFGGAPTSFTPALATLRPRQTFGDSLVTVNFGTALDNNAGPVWIRIVALNPSTGTGARDTHGLDDFQLSYTPPSISATTLSSFTTLAGMASAAQTYTLTGVNVSTSTAVVITAPTGFQVSLDGVTYTNVQSFTPATSGFSQLVYVRLTGTPTGMLAGNITNTNGSESATVAVTGTVVAEPTIAPTVTAAGAGATIITLTLGGGNGTKRLAVIHPVLVPRVAPVDGTTYVANTNVALSGTTGMSNFVVEAGTATTVNVTGLTANTNYEVDVYAYNDAPTAGFENYLLTPFGSATFSTLINPVVRWDGGGGNNSWFTATNWSNNIVPLNNEDVLLDHSFVAGAYTVSMNSNTPVVLFSLTINPSSTSGANGTDSITVLVPNTNTMTTALELTRSGPTETALAIYDKGVVVDNSGSTAGGAPINVVGADPTFFIFNGGSFRHYTNQGHANLVDNLSAAAGTENGIFDFRVDGLLGSAAYTVSLQGITYGKLILRHRATPVAASTLYQASGAASVATVQDDLLVGPNTNFELFFDNEFRLGGDLRVAGNFRFDKLGAGSSKLVFNGTSAQTINGTTLGLTSGLSYLGTGVELVVNNAAGLSLTTPVRVNGPLTLTTGIVATSATGLLTLASGYSLTGGSSTSFINGPLARATAIGAATTFFPLGKGTAYRPLTLTSTTQTSATTYTGELFNTSARTTGVDVPLTRVSNIRYATLTPDVAPTGFSGTLTMSFGLDDYVNDPAATSFQIAKRNGAGNWQSLGLPTAHTGTANGGLPVSGTLTSGLFTTFSDFALASTAPLGINTFNTSNPLPVELTRFTAQRQGAGPVAVQWRTASEHNSARFEVERSLDGVRFALVATASAQGTSSQPTAYAALDQTAPLAGLYYRLRQVDLDGTAVYSAVVRVAAGADVPRLEVYPNPAQGVLHFAVAAATPYRILTQVGQVRRQGTAAAGLATVPVEGLAPGLYLLELSTPTGRLVQKFEKQ